MSEDLRDKEELKAAIIEAMKTVDVIVDCTVEGMIHAPTGPGLGCDIDWDLVDNACTSHRVHTRS